VASFLASHTLFSDAQMEKLIRAIELHVNKSPVVARAVGPVYAAGDYKVHHAVASCAASR